MSSEFILMRHAKSDWNAEFRQDFDRPLNQRGCKDAVQMAQWLLDNDMVPDSIITSPAVRAHSTAELVADTLAYPLKKISDIESLYDAGLNAALHAVQQAVVENIRPLIISHNPVMDTLVEYLADHPPACSGSGKLMTTAAIAVFRTEGPIGQGSCELQYLVRPKELV